MYNHKSAFFTQNTEAQKKFSLSEQTKKTGNKNYRINMMLQMCDTVLNGPQAPQQNVDATEQIGNKLQELSTQPK